MSKNRRKKCPSPKFEIVKKEVWGAYDYRFDAKNEVLIVKWVDNKYVTMGINCKKIELTCNI